MNIIKINPNNIDGTIKCINAVNNGPVAPGVRDSYSNFELFKTAEIPYARNHDASFCSQYNGEHVVDVHRIFKNFDADENDPASYIFEPTDKLIINWNNAGTKTFYRLGASIEHYYKYGTHPPKDFEKWARICEHIIMHYNEGWAEGYEFGIEYWEIWNEPDCRNADGSNPCWQGTNEEFIDFYCTAAKHLKSRFPALKIGGPAFCTAWEDDYKNAFLSRVKKDNVPLDFFSYHCYAQNPDSIGESVESARELLRKNGISDNTELILNEWNYVKGWLSNDWKYTLAAEKDLRGAAFIAGAMSEAQRTGLDMLMYYDARPCAMNGMFANETYAPLKGYYPFVMARDIVRMGNYIRTEKVDDVHVLASTDGKDYAVMVTYYKNEDGEAPADVVLSFEDIKLSGNAKISYYLLDEVNDLKLVRDEYVNAENFDLHLTMNPLSSYLIKITN